MKLILMILFFLLAGTNIFGLALPSNLSNWKQEMEDKFGKDVDLRRVYCHDGVLYLKPKVKYSKILLNLNSTRIRPVNSSKILWIGKLDKKNNSLRGFKTGLYHRFDEECIQVLSSIQEELLFEIQGNPEIIEWFNIPEVLNFLSHKIFHFKFLIMSGMDTPIKITNSSCIYISYEFLRYLTRFYETSIDISGENENHYYFPSGIEVLKYLLLHEYINSFSDLEDHAQLGLELNVIWKLYGEGFLNKVHRHFLIMEQMDIIQSVYSEKIKANINISDLVGIYKILGKSNEFNRLASEYYKLVGEA